MAKGTADEDKLVKALQQRNMLAREAAASTLENIVNKGLATYDIQKSLLGAWHLVNMQKHLPKRYTPWEKPITGLIEHLIDIGKTPSKRVQEWNANTAYNLWDAV